MLLHSKAGSIRGGHAHDVDEVVVLLTGKLKYRKRIENDSKARPEWQIEMGEGDTIFHERGEYHLAEFTEESWLLEWKIQTNKKGWKNIDYADWRRLVQANAASGR